MLRKIDGKIIFTVAVLVAAVFIDGCSKVNNDIQPFSTMLPSELHDVAIEVGYMRYEGRGYVNMGRIYNKSGGFNTVAERFSQLISPDCPSIEIYKKNESSGSRVVIDAQGEKSDYQKDFIVECAIEILSTVKNQPDAFVNAKSNEKSWD